MLHLGFLAEDHEFSKNLYFINDCSDHTDGNGEKTLYTIKNDECSCSVNNLKFPPNYHSIIRKPTLKGFHGISG